MKFETVMKEIERISMIEDPETCQEEIKELNKRIKTPLIKKAKRGNYLYLYKVLEYRYDKETRHGRESKWEKVGRISLQDYESNKIKIEKLIESRDQEKLKKYMEEY